MKEQVKESRGDRRKSAIYKDKLIDLLGSFYGKMSSSQLTDEELQEAFTSHNSAWIKYCNSKKLNKDAHYLFAIEVDQTWKKKLAKANQ